MKVAAYIRVSTEDQAREGVSLEAQAERLVAYCTAKDWELVALERDEGISGKTLDRPGMDRILARVESRQVEVVLVYKLDRLTRSVSDLARLVELFERRGVSLVSLVESLDATTASGRLMMNLLASVSQWEREVIGERTREAMSYKRRHRQVYSPTPYGFTREGTALVEDEAEMRIVRRIKKWRAAGRTLTAIADALNKQEVPTKRGGRWAAATVRYMLRNNLYEAVA